MDRDKQESIDFMETFMKENYDDFKDLEFIRSIKKEAAKEIFEELNNILRGYSGDVLLIPTEEFKELKKRFT